jgi:hypothetical protein
VEWTRSPGRERHRPWTGGFIGGRNEAGLAVIGEKDGG